MNVELFEIFSLQPLNVTKSVRASAIQPGWWSLIRHVGDADVREDKRNVDRILEVVVDKEK